jgi:hypothetical protein
VDGNDRPAGGDVHPEFFGKGFHGPLTISRQTGSFSVSPGLAFEKRAPSKL